MTDTSFDQLPDRALIRVNELCNRFERHWQTDVHEPIESLLEDVDAEHRSLLAAELIALEVEFLTRRGESVSADAYVRRFPFVDPALIASAVEVAIDAIDGLAQLRNALPESTPIGESTQIGEYTVLEPIGSGGMGTVYKAVHRRMQRTVAIKLLLPEFAHIPRFRERFSREVQAAAKLKHANIVTAYDAGEFRGTPYLVSEFVDAQNLSQVVRESGPLPVGEALNVVIQAAHGLHYIHNQGIIHRDIKPSNLLLDNSGQLKILDVGLSRLSQDGAAALSGGDLSNSGMMMGTVDCMAPEQARSSRDADERSDIYSLGCTLFYLLTGRHCYGGPPPLDRILAHRQQPIPDLESPHGDVPVPLADVFRRMLAKRPEDRQASATELISELDACCSEHAIVSSATPTPHRRRDVEPFAVTSAGSESHRTSSCAVVPSPQVPRKRSDFTTGRGVITVLVLVLLALPLLPSVREFLSGDGPNDIPEPDPVVVDPAQGGPRLAVAPFDETAAQELQQTWAEHLGVAVALHDERIHVDFVLIPPGEFTMGSSIDELTTLTQEFASSLHSDEQRALLRSESPPRHVTISRPFYVSRTEVTLEQFQRFVNETGYVTDAERNDQGWGLRGGEWRQRESNFFHWKQIGEATEQLTDLHPVGNLSWNDAVAYCRWCSQAGVVCRLPTEAEWEYACRAGTETRFSWGDHMAAMHEFANIVEDGDFDSRAFADVVGLRRPNAFGLFDMHGNQAEFCRGWYADDAYQNESAVTDPAGPTSRQQKPGRYSMGRVIRGGRAGSVPVTARSAARDGSPEDSPAGGIRLVREVP